MWFRSIFSQRFSLFFFAFQVKENAANSNFNSSKSHVTLITSASKILRRVSPLRSRQVTYANHVCLLLHQRLTGVLNEVMASLQDIKTLANLVISSEIRIKPNKIQALFLG